MKLFLEIIYNFGILIAISIIAGFVFQKIKKRVAVAIIQGVLFGTAALIGMLNPVVVAPGLIFDGRSVMISLAALFYGPIAGIISAVMALALRLSQGGIGAKMGISVILASAIIGIVFHYKWILKNKRISEKHLLFFGFLVHIAMLICTIALPAEVRYNTLGKIWLSVLIVYPAAGIIIGRVLLNASDHWQTKQELESSEEKFRLLVKNASDIIVILEADGTQRYVSPAAEKITGFRICELQGRSMQEIIHPDDMPMVMELWMQLLANPDLMPIAQYRHIHKTKGWVYLEAVGQNLLAEPSIKGLVTSVRDISERKAAEAALKESEEKFRILAESTPTAIMIYQNDKWIYANEAALEITEYSEQEIYQMQFWDFVHPEDSQLIKTRGQNRQNGISDINRYEMRIITKTGKTKWMNLTGASAIIKGKPAGILSIIDITERKKAESELIANEERIRLLLDLAPDAFFQGDPNGNLIDCNNRAIDITGYTKEELIGKNISVLFSKKILSNKPLNYEALKQGAILKTERELLRKEGASLPIEMCSKQMPDGTYQSFFRDISERKLAEEALLNEKEQLSVTLRSIGDGVITTDTDGTIIMLNSVAEKMTGWNQEDAAGKALNLVFNIINEASGKPCDNPVEKVLQTGQIQELANHTILISKDGSRRIIGDSGAPIKDQSGKILGVVLVFRDMTEKQKLLEVAQQSQKLDSIGILAGGIAHDFNNLLGGIFGYIGLAKAQSDNENTIELLDKAHNAIERAKNLTHQLLTFAKGGEPVKTNQMINSFLKETVQFALSGSAISARYEIPDSLYSANIDRNQIAQVIDNIVINAIESMPSSGVITIKSCNIEQNDPDHPLLPVGKYIKTTISDQGIGIPKEIINHIFDPFFTTKSSGHGLGLAMSYSIIRKHEGIIEVESEPGKGSSFSIFLPAAPSLEIIVEQTTPQKAQTVSGRILVMDDEPMLREIISEILKACGYEVAAVADGESAVRLFTEEKNAGRPFKAVIFDLTIPGGMGGKEAIAQIRKIDKEVAAFVSSGYSVDPVVANPREFGFWGSIPKPFTFSELQETLDKYLNT